MWDFHRIHRLYRIHRNGLCASFKEYCSPNIDWMQFYNQFSGWVGIVAGIAFIGSAIYLMQRYKMEKQNLPTECYHPTDNATNAFPQIQSTPTGNE